MAKNYWAIHSIVSQNHEFTILRFYEYTIFLLQVIMPLSQRLIDAENAHKLAIWAGRHNLLFSKRIKVEDEQILVSKADLSLVCCKKKKYYSWCSTIIQDSKRCIPTDLVGIHKYILRFKVLKFTPMHFINSEAICSNHQNLQLLK